MAEVRGFRGWRFDLGQVGDLEQVVAPPYDVIDTEQQTALYKQHPCNVVRLILNREEPGDSSPDARYERAAGYLRHWQSSGTLIREHEDTLYVYHQQFDWEGRTYNRRGFLGLLKLEPFGQGQVFPHEQTMPGPRADRLALLRACRTNLSPVFGLYADDDGMVQEPLEQAIRTLTPLACGDGQGVEHRMWPVMDGAVINQVRAALAERAVFIADGHHRYETACTYQRERAAEDGTTGNESPADFVLMHLVSMNDPGLVILPTHRLIEDGPDWDRETLTRVLEGCGELTDVGSGAEGAAAARELLEADGRQNMLGFGTRDGHWLLVELPVDPPPATSRETHSAEWRSLGVSRLHGQIIDGKLAPHVGQKTLACRYVHSLDEAAAAVTGGTCKLACLVPPADINDVEQIASGGEQMPPKSTFFYPKLLSGLVFNPLD